MKAQKQQAQRRTDEGHPQSATRLTGRRWRRILCLGCLTPFGLAAETLLPFGTLWKYLDDGSDQGALWRGPAFADSGWAVGRAQLGYGDGDETTVVNFGTDSNNKFITTYFRHSFPASDPSIYSDLTLSLVRDDGAVVYLNGREVFRSNMPSGAVTYRTMASGAVGGSAESSVYSTTLGSTNLVRGTNVLAVEVHQARADSSDVSFDLELVGNQAPIVASLLAPTDNAADVSTTPTLEVAVPNPRGGELTVTVHGRIGNPPGPDFTVIGLPDSQYNAAGIKGGHPSNFTAQTDWTVANRVARDIGFVIQLGDMVESGENGGNDSEWRNATNAMYRLEDPVATLAEHGIPYGISRGNHDGDRIANFYNQYFGIDHFTGRDYYGGHFGTNNNNHYELFSASGLDFIVIHLEYQPDNEVLDWANAVLGSHPERRAIVASHYLLGRGDPASFEGPGQAVYDALKSNANLFLMLCGHVPGEGRRQDTFNGNTVYTLLSDYQDLPNGGGSWLRIMEFSPQHNVIRVYTYSPTTGEYNTNASGQFTLSYDLRSGGDYEILVSITDVSSATNLSVPWPGLSHATAYDWYVTVTDGTNTTTSPIHRFTTARNRPPTVAVTRISETPITGFVPSVVLAIQAAAADSDGTVSKVEFFQAGAALGEDTDSPFDCTWYNVPVGTYSITAIAEDNGGLRATSAPVSITVTLSGDPSGEPVTAPSDLTATAVSSNQILLEWTDNAANEAGFGLERSAPGTSFAQVALLDPDTQSWVDGDVEAGTQYTYRVRAFTSNSVSDFSNLATVTIPAHSDPGSFSIRLRFDRLNNAMVLSWPSVAATVYRVIVKNNITDPYWNDLSEEITASSILTTWAEPLTGATPTRFYGVRVVR